MSIISFVECERVPLAVREDGSLHGERSFDIRSTDYLTTLTAIRAHITCPVKGSAHPDQVGCLLRSFDVERADGFHDLHQLTANYDTKSSEDSDEEDPTFALVKAGFRAQDKIVPSFFDAFARPNVNTAGDLIEGLTKFANEYVISVTVNRTYVPLWLFELNNTLNAGAVYFRGITFPAGTLLLKNITVPDAPEEGPDGTKFWALTYELIHAPDGHYELHPNRGKHELIYQARTASDKAWQDVTYTFYDAHTPTSDRQIIKRRIKTDDEKPVAADIWLDGLGRAVTVPTIATTSPAQTATMAAYSHDITMSGGVFTAGDEGSAGAAIAIQGAGPHGRWLQTRVDSVASTTSAALEDSAKVAVSGATVYFPGVTCIRVVNQPLADWSAVLLPDNDP